MLEESGTIFKMFPDVPRQFFKMLPEAFEKQGVKILNDEKQICVRKTWHHWDTITRRAPSYFDIVLHDKSTKEFSSSVFWKLRDCQPRDNHDAKARLQLFLRHVDSTSPPVICL